MRNRIWGDRHHEERWKLSEWANIGLPLNWGQNCWIFNLSKIPLWAGEHISSCQGKCSYRLKSKIKDRLNEETVYILYFQSACICMSVTLSMKSCLIERDVYLVSVMTVGDARGVNYTFQLTHSLGRGGTLFRRVVSSHRSKVENSEYVRC